jgi:rhodanese-related sulfurtransferase
MTYIVVPTITRLDRRWLMPSGGVPRAKWSPMSDLPHPHAMLGRGPVATISREELKLKLDANEPIKLVMALNRWAFDAKHIPGSLYFEAQEDLYAALDPNDEIIVYCSNIDCLASVALYWALLDRGYLHVKRYAGGLIDWEDAGMPLEGSSS